MSKPKILIMILTVCFLFISAVAFASGQGCLSCHEGIEKFSDVPGMAQLTCTDCHQGNKEGVSKDEAHRDMYRNPSDLRVVDETCGTCHSEKVKNLEKSLHATSAGKISGARYTWGAQDEKNAIYSTYAVKDKDGKTPIKKGAKKQLKKLPKYNPDKPISDTNHPVDDYLRNQCLRCHVWSEGHQRDGDWRASGCAACHVIYDNDGTYKGNDQAIDKSKKGYPRKHKLTTKIDSNQCQHCHNRGGRTGVSYMGMMEDPYGAPWTDEGKKQSKLHGKNYKKLQADVHYKRGLECIDCHTSEEMHGDGNIYSKKEQAVDVRCKTCHGTADKPATLKDADGNKLNNLRKENGKVILTAKVTGKEHIIPEIKDQKETISKEGQVAMFEIEEHQNNLECYSCHSEWAPQCYGCHAKQDLRKTGGDYINNKKLADESQKGDKDNRKKTAFSWKESRSYTRWESPTLGINARGKVSPFIPGCQAIFTQIGKDGKAIFESKVFTTADGKSGIATNPIQPHTVSESARSCESCHASDKAVGLGNGIFDSKANGLPIDFGLEEIVDKNGNQIQATSHVGARPFNKEEIERIRRVGTCLSCHGVDENIWDKVEDIYKGDADTNKMHKEAIEKALKKSVE